MKFNYASLLRARGQHVPPRVDPETLSSALAQRNVAARVAWLIRWHERRPLPDAWEGVGRARAFYNLALATKRQEARRWLAERAEAARPRNVLTLRRKKL